MAVSTSIVFVVDDDISVRESLELSIRNALPQARKRESVPNRDCLSMVL
jgi:FixJ family two-component response regulator